MIAPRWRKMWRDLLERRGRSLLVVIAMAAGIFQIAAMLYKYALLQPELTTIEQPIDEIASTAVDLLRTVIAEPARSMQRVLVQPRLRAGGSTAAPAPL